MNTITSKEAHLIKDYARVLLHTKDEKKVSVEKVNDIILQNKYFRSEKFQMVLGATTELVFSFLQAFKEDYEIALIKLEKINLEKKLSESNISITKNKMKI